CLRCTIHRNREDLWMSAVRARPVYGSIRWACRPRSGIVNRAVEAILGPHLLRCPRWIRDRRRGCSHMATNWTAGLDPHIAPDLPHSALVVIDTQIDFVDGGASPIAGT